MRHLIEYHEARLLAAVYTRDTTQVPAIGHPASKTVWGEVNDAAASDVTVWGHGGPYLTPHPRHPLGQGRMTGRISDVCP